MMLQARSWHEGTPFVPVVLQFLGELFPNFDERDRFDAIFNAFDTRDPEVAKISLREASFMKLFCDSFFLVKFVKPLMDRRKTGP